MEEVTKKNLRATIFVLVGMYAYCLINTILRFNMPYTLEYIFSALGYFLPILVIPIVVSAIAKFFFKKLFLRVFWKATLIIGIPIFLLALIGQLYEI